MGQKVHILIAEPSPIIKRGVVSILEKLANIDLDIAEINEISTLLAQIQRCKPDILIANPSHLGLFYPHHIRAKTGLSELKIIALQHNLLDDSILKQYDEVISIYSNIDVIKDKLINAIPSKDKEPEKQELSTREREIVICIVKGLTNKQIAEQLYLSTHTIMSHRRNITNKLQIHSSAGLTIYAIVNKLVELDDIKSTISSEKSE